MSYSKLLEKAQNANALATTEDIVLATDQAFYNVLQAEALLKVAQQTVTTRGSVQHQIDELTKSKLKSGLDLSFADVNLSQAKLLQLDAQTTSIPRLLPSPRFSDSTSRCTMNGRMRTRNCPRRRRM